MSLRGPQKWARIRAAYLAGATDLHKLALRFRVSEAQLIVTCAAENWPVERLLLLDEQRRTDLSLAVEAWKFARVRAGRLGLLRVCAQLEQPGKEHGPRDLALLMTAANRALPAVAAIPEMLGSYDHELVVLDADGRDFEAAREAADALAPKPGGPRGVLPKPK